MAEERKSRLGAKYGQRADKAVAAHANDETTYGFIRIPGGIARGVAQLQRCYFEEYKEGDMKGEFYFRAVGVILEPTVPIPSMPISNAPLISVQGLTTSLMIPVCDAKRYGKEMTLDENIAEIQLHMRRLGGPDFTAEVQSIDELEDLAAELEQMGPVFVFKTSWAVASKDKPATATSKAVVKGELLVDKGGNYMVNESWSGTQGLEDYVVEEEEHTNVKGGAATAMATTRSKSPSTTVKETKEKLLEKPKAETNGKHSTKATVTMKEAKPTEDEEMEDEDLDLDALAEDADSESDTAADSGEKLIEIAETVGIDRKVATAKSTTWEKLVEMIQEKQDEHEGDTEESGEGDDEDSEDTDDDEGDDDESDTEDEDAEEDEGTEDVEEEYEPSVGDTVLYSPIDPKTKKKVTKPVVCGVSHVKPKAKTVNLKAGKAEYKEIPWDEIMPQ